MSKFIRRNDKNGHFILIKGTLHKEETASVKIYIPDVSASNFI
jgi:hypothetical protein